MNLNERIPTIEQNISSRKVGNDKMKMRFSRSMSLIERRKSRDSRLGSSAKQCATALLLVTFTAALVADLSKFLRPQAINKSRSGELTAPVWASWIGEVPTAAEMYGDASADMPTTEAFDDDDEEPDEELDASASNEYPENDNDNENDESYEDQDENPDGAESRRRERWLTSASGSGSTARQVNVWRPQGRSKRDLEDRLVLASRRRAQHASRRANDNNNNEDDFAVEDGDEDAWVHDGVDDIHIDPETKKAASELSVDERSIDAEYEPYAHKEPPVLNRTRITTIAEVIPMNTDDADSNDKDSSKVNWHFLSPPTSSASSGNTGAPAAASQKSPSVYLPASYLTIDQAQKLIGQQHEQLRQQQRQLESQRKQLAALSAPEGAGETWSETAPRRQLAVDRADSSLQARSPGGATGLGDTRETPLV